MLRVGQGSWLFLSSGIDSRRRLSAAVYRAWRHCLAAYTVVVGQSHRLPAGPYQSPGPKRPRHVAEFSLIYFVPNHSLEDRYNVFYLNCEGVMELTL